MLAKIYCDLTNGQFVAGFRDRSEPRIVFGQDNDLFFRLHLLQSLGDTRWPFAYDSWSGDPDVSAIVSLRDLRGYPGTTLASTAPLTVVRHGFEGLLHTNTLAVANYLSGGVPASEKPVSFCLDLVDGSGYKISPFRGEILLRSAPAGAATSSGGTILYFPEVTSYLGAEATALQAKSTADQQPGVIFEAVIGGILTIWRLESGTADTDLDQGIIKPNDFDATTNALNLVRVGGI